MDDFENFEFIDYTTSGPWERFITQIEDTLRTWGLVDRSLGLLDPDHLSGNSSADQPRTNTSSSKGKHSKDRKHSTQPHPESDQKTALPASRQPTSQKNGSVFHLREMISLDDSPYALSYQYHPGGTRLAAGDERIDLNFLPPFLEGAQHHKLHRWTGLTHILTLTPVTISDIFASSVSSAASAIIDLSSAKLLLSSFAIAFQNTGCKVPVFVPTGQPWNLTFTGLGILPQAPPSLLAPGAAVQDEEEEGEDEAFEVRYNTVLVPYPPVQYTYLSGIMDLFIERMGLEDMDPARSLGVHGQIIKERIKVSAMFSYDLMNWYDDDWRRWKQDEEEEGQSSADSTEKLQDPDMPFKTDEEEKQIDLDASMNMQDIKTEERTSTTLPLPILPFGPVQDPLQSMRLFARFCKSE